MKFKPGNLVSFVGIRKPLRFETRKPLRRFLIKSKERVNTYRFPENEFCGKLGIILDMIDIEELWWQPPKHYHRSSVFSEDDYGFRVMWLHTQEEGEFYGDELCHAIEETE